ncbi:hypothetical protein [Azospirillum agricola]|uniref:hypothetical protein n=1 Tax=Azospirillum agricola TaxID=1720247 RepID=UPI000A0EF101|nr:hypothetical protein [Azospirillum agricola]SMH43008.1 hypothetical protein SAMN02982994_1796 [Azospirillum lipoferum]
MQVWRRYLVRDVSGRLVDLPARLLDRADDGTAPLPAYAGRCVEVVAAVLVGDPKSSARLAEMEFTKLYFDKSGFVDAAKRERMIRLMLESCADPVRRLPRVRTAIRWRTAPAPRDLLTREFGWDPKPAELNAVLSRLDPARLDREPKVPGHALH